jgi:hypothetical protein
MIGKGPNFWSASTPFIPQNLTILDHCSALNWWLMLKNGDIWTERDFCELDMGTIVNQKGMTEDSGLISELLCMIKSPANYRVFVLLEFRKAKRTHFLKDVGMVSVNPKRHKHPSRVTTALAVVHVLESNVLGATAL